MGKKNNKNHFPKYRLVVNKESIYGSWREIEWEGETKWDGELDKLYCEWLNKKRQYSRIQKNLSSKVNGSESKIEERVTDVHVQIGNYDKKHKRYKWEDYDYRGPLEEIKISMR